MSLLRTASVVGAATLMSRVLGLVREQVLAYLFGAGNVTDAFNIAFRIPNLLRNLLAEGAMSAALIPTFLQVKADEGEARAWQVARRVFVALLAVGSGVALLGIACAPFLVGLYASSFKAIPGKFELTVDLTRVLFPFFPFVALGAAFMGVLNAYGKFFIPAFSSALFNLVAIVTGVGFSFWMPRFGIQPIIGMAIGVVLGGMVQALSQLPLLLKSGFAAHVRRRSSTVRGPGWKKDPALRRMLWLMSPAVVGLGATQLSILINSLLATTQSPGAVSWLNYAFRLLQFPIGLFGVSLAAATLPRVATAWVGKDLEEVDRTLQQSLRHTLAINLPASAGLAFLSFPIIQLLFEYGRFYSSDTEATALALAIYSLGLTAYALVKVLVPSCYALGSTRLPVISSLMSVGLTIILSLLLIHPLGYLGLALATSIASIFNAVFLLFALRSLLRQAGGSFKLAPLGISFLKNLAASIAMGVACHFTYRGLAPAFPDMSLIEFFGKGSIPIVRAFKVGLVMAEGVVLLVVLGKMLGLPEMTEVLNIFTKKLKKKLSQNQN